MLDQIKILLGIDDTKQDAVLTLIISNVTSHLKFLLSRDVPEELQFIILEISVMRFNRLGSEGMKSELTEGHRSDFFEPVHEFRPYLSIIEEAKEKETPAEPKRGQVMFI